MSDFEQKDVLNTASILQRFCCVYRVKEDTYEMSKV